MRYATIGAVEGNCPVVWGLGVSRGDAEQDAWSSLVHELKNAARAEAARANMRTVPVTLERARAIESGLCDASDLWEEPR